LVFFSAAASAATPTQGFILILWAARKITLLIRFRRNYIHVSAAVENGGD